MHLADIVTALRPSVPHLLVAVDFDGTLAPLVSDPEASRPVDGSLEALTLLAERGAQVAVITGRDARTVLRVSGFADIPRLVVAGMYGIETWHDGHLDTPPTPPALAQLRERLPELLARHGTDPDVWIEDKRLSLVVHARRAADPDVALAPLQQPVRELAAELELEVHPGRDVLEVRVCGYDKAGALRRLLGRHTAVLYAGDDLGDLPAFAEITALRAQGRTAYGVAVTSSGVAEVAAAADAQVATSHELVELLRALT